MGDRSDGEYLTISQAGKEAQQKKKDKENDSPPAPQAETSPAKTDGGLDPGRVDVDEFYVETLGQANLPGVDDAADYRNQARKGVFTKLSETVVTTSGVDVPGFVKSVSALTDQVAKSRVTLDTKTVAVTTMPAAAEFEPLPGVAPDAVCQSRFDANDWALTGKKAVTAPTVQPAAGHARRADSARGQRQAMAPRPEARVGAGVAP
jgi:hypothetical protein